MVPLHINCSTETFEIDYIVVHYDRWYRWKHSGDLGTVLFSFFLFLSLFWITYLKMYLQATDCDKKALHSEGFKSDPSSVSTTSIIAAQWCEMMDWLSSDSDMCCHSVIERQQLKLCTAVEDSANIHDTPSDGEVYTCTDWKDPQIFCMWGFVPLSSNSLLVFEKL